MTTEGALAERLRDEVARLEAWHEIAVKHRGGTTLGATGLTPSGLAEYLAAWLADTPARSFREGLSPADALKLACRHRPGGGRPVAYAGNPH